MTTFHDDVLGTIRPQSSLSFTFKLNLPDGTLTGVFEVMLNEEPSEQQRSLMRRAVQNVDNFKRLAVMFVRELVLTEPERYGLLEQDGQPCSWTAPYFLMNEAEYFKDFRLSSLRVRASLPEYLFASYSTELDPEHGIPVTFRDGLPIEAFS